MNAIDEIMGQVFTACNADIHGRPAQYYTSAADGTGIPINVVVKPDAWRSMFDTGTDDLNFDAFPAMIGVNDVATQPEIVGRGSTGARIIFTAFPSVTWYVRNVGASADYVGAYYDIALTSYNGPINGV